MINAAFPLLSTLFPDLPIPLLGTEASLAESVKGQPLEPVGKGGETIYCSVQAVYRDQASPCKTRAKW